MTPQKVVKWKPVNMDFAGTAAVTKKAPASIYAFDSKGNFILLYKLYTLSATVGMLSGKGVEMNDGLTYYLITLKNTYKDYVFGYVTLQDFYFSKVRAVDEAAAKNDAQVLFNNLVASDNLLQIKINAFYELLKQAKAKGIDVSKQEAETVKIANSWKERQNSIATNPLIKITKKISGPHSIGVIPLLVWGLAIGAGTVLVGITVYYFLKPEYNTSQLHSKYLVENEAELRAKLGDKGFEQLKTAVDKEIKEAAETAYSEGNSGGIMKVVKPLVFMAAGFILITKFKNTDKI